MGRRALAVMVALVVGMLAAARIEAQPVRPYQISVSLVPGWNNIGYVGQTRPYIHGTR
jgi:hypothetical protein